MAKSECVTCLWEADHGVSVIPGFITNTAWAQRVGVSEASIRRHMAHSKVSQEASAFKDRDGDQILSEIDVPEEYVTSRGMSLRDPITGSWHKVTWQPNKKALYDARQTDDLVESLRGWAPIPYAPKDTSERAAVLNMADLQIGKANQRWGGTDTTLASARASIDRFTYYILDEGIRTVVLVDNGDPIENCFNVPAQLVTNDLSVPAQIRTFRLLLLEAVKRIAPLVAKLFVVSVPSNHGAHRTGYKTPGGTVDADFGLDINEQVELACKQSPYLKHVEFVRPRALEEVATLYVAGTQLAFAHGHQSGGVFQHGNWWKGMDHGRMDGWDADIFVFGHFHTQAVYQSGNGRWVVGTASSDPGSDHYTNRTGESSTRGMTAFDVLGGGQPLNVRII